MALISAPGSASLRRYTGGARPDRFSQTVLVAARAEHQHASLWFQGVNLGSGTHAIHVRQLNIHEDQVDRLGGKNFKRLGAVLGESYCADSRSA